MDNQSAVSFPGSARIHIALAVTNLTRSQKFYETLFGVSPTKERPGYIKFEPQDPSVNLTLNESNDKNKAMRSVVHYGVQVKTSRAIQEAIARFSDEGLQPRVEEHTTCCYAVQEKVWITDPEGNQWEIFMVLDPDVNDRGDTESNCCATTLTEPLAKQTS